MKTRFFLLLCAALATLSQCPREATADPTIPTGSTISLSLNASTHAIAGPSDFLSVNHFALTTGSYSDPSWITSLAWSKIASHPTTLSGYGITDHIVTYNASTFSLVTPTQTQFSLANTVYPNAAPLFDSSSDLLGAQGDLVLDSEESLYLNGYLYDATASHGTNKQVMTSEGAGGGAIWADPVQYILIQDQKASGTAGGTSTSSAIQARTLNVIVHDDTGVVTLSGIDPVIPAGTYRVSATAPAWAADRTKLFLYNVTGSAVLVTGQASYNTGASSDGNSGPAMLHGWFTVSGTTTIELRQYFQAGIGTNGFGVATGDGSTEIYSELELFKQ